MNILMIGNFGRGWDNSICDEEHIAKALEDLGHEVFRWQREAVLELPVDDYDFTLIQQWDGYPEDLSFLPKPIVYWAFDYQADGQEWHERLVKQADLYLSKRIADSKYPNWRWLSQDFAPEILLAPKPRPRDIDVVFTGSYLDWATERNETIKAVGEKFNLVIHSVNQWPQGNEGPIMDEGLMELYSRTKIVLAIDHTLEAGYWSDRAAQAMVCNAFVLQRYVPLMEARFGDKLTYFYSIEDCLEKIAYWLENSNDRQKQAYYGGMWARDNMYVTNRVKDLLAIVESIL